MPSGNRKCVWHLIRKMGDFSQANSSYYRARWTYVLAALVLQNYLRQTSIPSYTPTGFVYSEKRDSSIHLTEWCNRDNRQCMEDIRPIRGCQNRLEVIQMRENIKTCFNSEQGILLWQLDYARRTYRKDNFWNTIAYIIAYCSIYYHIIYVLC